MYFFRNQSLIRTKRDEEVVCYPDLGCFFDDGPFDYLDLLPDPPEVVNTKLLLFTRENREKPQFVSYTNMTRYPTNIFMMVVLLAY